MNQYSRNRQFPAGNPLANVLVVIVGALAIGLSVIVGVVAFVALGAALIVLGSVIGIRLWWLNRRMARHKPRPDTRSQSSVEIIEGEYRVVREQQRDDTPPQ